MAVKRKATASYDDVGYMMRELREGCGAVVYISVLPQEAFVFCEVWVSWTGTLTPLIPPLKCQRRVLFKDASSIPLVLYQWLWACYMHFNQELLLAGSSRRDDPYHDYTVG